MHRFQPFSSRLSIWPLSCFLKELHCTKDLLLESFFFFSPSFFYKIWHTWSPFNHAAHKEKEASVWWEDELQDASFNVLFCYSSPSAVALGDHWGTISIQYSFTPRVVLLEPHKLNVIFPALHVSRRFLCHLKDRNNNNCTEPSSFNARPFVLLNNIIVKWASVHMTSRVSSRDLRVTHPQQVATLLRHMGHIGVAFSYSIRTLDSSIYIHTHTTNMNEVKTETKQMNLNINILWIFLYRFILKHTYFFERAREKKKKSKSFIGVIHFYPNFQQYRRMILNLRNYKANTACGTVYCVYCG